LGKRGFGERLPDFWEFIFSLPHHINGPSPVLDPYPSTIRKAIIFFSKRREYDNTTNTYYG